MVKHHSLTTIAYLFANIIIVISFSAYHSTEANNCFKMLTRFSQLMGD